MESKGGRADKTLKNNLFKYYSNKYLLGGYMSKEKEVYRKLQDYDDTKTKTITKIITKQGIYSYHKKNKTLIVRAGRLKDERKQFYFNIEKKITAETNVNKSIPSFIKKYLKTKYGQKQSAYFHDNIQKVKEEFKEFKRSKCSNLEIMHNIGSSLALLDPVQLWRFFCEDVIPEFFKIYKNGKIFIISNNFEYETLGCYIRALYCIQQFGTNRLLKLKEKSFPSLKNWEPIQPSNLCETLLTNYGYFWFPNVTTYTNGPIGLDFVFFFDKAEISEPPKFPLDWIDVISSKNDFAFDSVDIVDAIKNPAGKNAKKAIYQKFINKANFKMEENLLFFEYYLKIINEFMYQLTDIANFTNDSNRIDHVFCFEIYLTISRLIKRTMSIFCTKNASLIKYSVFEVADIYDSLNSLFNKAGETIFFKKLFNPEKALKILEPCLKKLPEPFCSYTITTLKNIYAELKGTIEDSIWLEDIKDGDKVKVMNKNLDNEQEETLDDFVANLMRAYRNAHHGYFTALDNKNRPSRYLSIVKGDLPDSISFLPILWLLAFLNEPQIIGWKPIKF